MAYVDRFARMMKDAHYLWEVRGHTFYQPQFEDADWDETELSIRVDAIEGDEEKRKDFQGFVYTSKPATV